MLDHELEIALSSARVYFEKLVATPPIIVGRAMPPSTSGVYAFSLEDEIVYVGESAGSRGLRDRIKSKHLSGDDSHALQAAFLFEFPDRKARRAHLKEKIGVRWVEIPDSLLVSVVEKLAIFVLKPRFNQSVASRSIKEMSKLSGKVLVD